MADITDYLIKGKGNLLCGEPLEQYLKPQLEKHYGATLNKTTTYAHFDFKDSKKKLVVEIKGRKVAHNKYRETMIGHCKIKRGLKLASLGYTIVLLFSFVDGVWEYKLTPENYTEKRIRDFTYGERTTPYYYIPIRDLTKV